MMHMKHISTFNVTRTRTSCLAYFILIIIGVAAGSFIAVKAKLPHSLWTVQGFMASEEYISAFSVAKDTFLSLALFAAAAFFFGFSAVGQPFALAMLIYRGTGIGIALTTIYAVSGRKAFLRVMLLVFPKAVAVAVISVLAVREAVRFSNSLFNCCVRRESHDDSKNSMKLYAFKFFVLILISLFISAADGGANYLYSAVAGQ